MVLNTNGLFPSSEERWNDEIVSGIVKPRSINYYVGGDYNQSLAFSTTEIELNSFTIPAGTVVNGITVIALIAYGKVATGWGLGGFHVRVGAVGQNGRLQIQMALEKGSLDIEENAQMRVTIDDLDWDVDQKILITASSNNINDEVVCYYLDIFGF